MESKITALVARVILENTGRAVTPEPADPLISSGYLDSMTMVSLIVALQDEFGVRLDLGDMSVQNFETVQAIAELVRVRVG